MQHQERLQFPQLQICKFEHCSVILENGKICLQHAQKVVPEGDRASTMQGWKAWFQMLYLRMLRWVLLLYLSGTLLRLRQYSELSILCPRSLLRLCFGHQRRSPAPVFSSLPGRGVRHFFSLARCFSESGSAARRLFLYLAQGLSFWAGGFGTYSFAVE